MRQPLKLRVRDRAKPDGIAGAQKRRRAFSRIEQAERGAPDDIPAAWRFDRVNSRLGAADPKRAGGDFFSGRDTARRGQVGWQTAKKRKGGGGTQRTRPGTGGPGESTKIVGGGAG